MRIPVNNPYAITTAFGAPDSNAKFGKHSGIDYAVPLNRPIYAPTSGSLSNIVSPTGGNMVVIFDGKYYHRLMHNSSFSRGSGHVSEGDEVARAGTTGLSTGVHCHWDVNTEGVVPTSFAAFVDPDSIIGKEGEEMQEWNDGDIKNLYKALHDHDPTDKEVADYKSWLKNNKDVLIYDTIIRRINELKQSAQPVGFKPYVEPQLYVKE